jgi:hypothetical protein
VASSQIAPLQRLWEIAGLPPVSGYGSVILGMAAASDPTFAATLSEVDFDDCVSISDAVNALLRWRQRTFG